MKIFNFIKSEAGATAIEYALIATGVSLAIAVSVYAFGDQMIILYDWMATALSGE